jgi:hypothetical protein
MRLALASRLKPFIWRVKSTPAVGFPHGAPPRWKVSRVVHSLFKDTHMRKIILAAAVAGAALSLVGLLEDRRSRHLG